MSKKRNPQKLRKRTAHKIIMDKCEEQKRLENDRNPIDYITITLAYLNRYSLPIVILIIGAFIAKQKIFILVLGILVLFYGLIELIGYLLKWRFIYCSYQNAYHLKMTPNCIDWNWILKFDAYGVPAIFIGMGIVAIIVYAFI